ncbi:MAG: hypothetical protein WKF36_05375 [Candidatus Nitrosocosmicus sp.]
MSKTRREHNNSKKPTTIELKIITKDVKYYIDDSKLNKNEKWR